MTDGPIPHGDFAQAPSAPPSRRAALRRKKERGHYDAETVHAILEEGLVCHLGFTDDRGPMVVPMAYGRIERTLYLHGAAANAALRSVSGDVPVCVTVTLVDGLVLARSAFHHSINYRSVTIFGLASEVSDVDEKRNALTALVEHLVAGRSDDARVPTTEELRATRVVRLALDECSAKVRTGGPVDEPWDFDLEIWAGEIPLQIVAQSPVADQGAPVRAEVPTYATQYRRGTTR